MDGQSHKCGGAFGAACIDSLGYVPGLGWLRSISEIPQKCYVMRVVIQCRGAEMPQPLIVSNRGQVTLPAATRKRLGIKGGDVVIMEDRGSEIVLKPGVVLEIQHYDEDQIAQRDADDKLEGRERRRILDALTPSK